MVRQPRECGPDAWKQWLLGGLRLFDRTWSGWAVVWWLFSLGVVYLIPPGGHFLAVIALSALSGVAFGAHVAVLDELARGKRGLLPGLRAIVQDVRANRNLYLKSAWVRALFVSLSIPLVALFAVGMGMGTGVSSTPPPTPVPVPFWKLWSIWGWVWIIPSGWQRGGALGWGHWLLRRERQSKDATELLVRLGIALNSRSYLFTVGWLLVPSLLIMMAFPPLLPLWDIYAAAVCWCAWDEVFGPQEGLKDMQKSTAASKSISLKGA